MKFLTSVTYSVGSWDHLSPQQLWVVHVCPHLDVSEKQSIHHWLPSSLSVVSFQIGHFFHLCTLLIASDRYFLSQNYFNSKQPTTHVAKYVTHCFNILCAMFCACTLYCLNIVLDIAHLTIYLLIKLDIWSEGTGPSLNLVFMCLSVLSTHIFLCTIESRKAVCKVWKNVCNIRWLFSQLHGSDNTRYGA
jgi:hypothetical protein